MPVNPSEVDNLYPRSGEYFSPSVPEEQKDEQEQEEAEVFNSLPLIQGLMDRMSERIAFRDSIKAIKVDVEDKPELHQKMCLVNEMLADALREERSMLEAYIKEYIPGA